MSSKMKRLLLLCLCIAFTNGCGQQKEETETGQNHSTEEIQAEELSAEEVQPEETTTEEVCADEPFSEEAQPEEIQFYEEQPGEIRIDYPFPYSMEDYMLILVPSDEGEYEVRLFDERGRMWQHFSCGKLEEPLRFLYDDLNGDSYNDVEIFSSVEGSESKDGILLIRDQESKGFKEEPVRIPEYIENRWDGFLVAEEEEEQCEYTVCQINEEMARTEPLRRWTLQKETETLKIWDCLSDQCLFEGTVMLDVNGQLENEEYYEFLFWNDMPILGNFSADSHINTWISGEDVGASAEDQGLDHFEYIQEQVFGNEGTAVEYEDRETLLKDFGFLKEEPFYEYYDTSHNLLLELYFDEKSQKGCGIKYKYYYTNKLEQVVKMYGFTFNTVYRQKWEEPELFSITSLDGKNGADEVENYEEFWEYREDGKVDSFHSQGIIEWVGDGTETSSILKIQFVYREDGSLYYKDYSHNSNLFGTTFCTLHSYYDEAQRLLYQSGYITHGSCEYYYIYKDDGRTPAYCLSVDNNLGYVIPVMLKFE